MVLLEPERAVQCTGGGVVGLHLQRDVTCAVDGAQVGSNALTNADAYLGYWRIGGDRVWSGTSNYFSGQLAEAAVYPTALSGDAVLAHFVAAGRTASNSSVMRSSVQICVPNRWRR